MKKNDSYHRKDDGHHAQFAVGQRLMMIDMGSPCPIQRNQPTGIDGLAKQVLGNEGTLVPGYDLFFVWILCSVFVFS